MADQSRLQWAGDRLPDDVLYEMARRIPCVFDRLNMGRFRHSWRVALAKIKPPAPPPQLPWLVLPKADGPSTSSCLLSGCRTHPFFLPGNAQHERYFGSYDGAWLFLALGGRAQRQALVNLDNFELRDLPNLARLSLKYSTFVDHEMAIVAATLSCQPTEQGCIVAGIIESSPFRVADGHVIRRIAFWRMGDQLVLPPIWRRVANQLPENELQDVLYHKGAFHFLIGMEHIITCDEPPAFHEYGVRLVPVNMFFQRRMRHDGEVVLARYLVESRERLLMVVKLASGRRQQNLPTSAFRVFQKKEFNTGEEDEPFNNGPFQFPYYWSELRTLDGRMLFVGRGCSRSYEAANGHPGMEGVYFLDDRSFQQPIIGDAPKLPYRCSDNGKWSEAPTPQVDRCFPERDPSIYSPPIWILP